MSLTIRAAKPGDAALVAGFIHGLAEYERLAHECEADEAKVTQALFCASPRVFCDIAEWDGQAAGFALWFYNFSTFRTCHGLYLEDLFVRPEHRSRGIGKGLIDHLARRCVDEGLKRLEWSVLEWNAPAIQFYEGLGAELMSEWRICRLTGAALEARGRG